MPLKWWKGGIPSWAFWRVGLVWFFVSFFGLVGWFFCFGGGISLFGAVWYFWFWQEGLVCWFGFSARLALWFGIVGLEIKLKNSLRIALAKECYLFMFWSHFPWVLLKLQVTGVLDVLVCSRLLWWPFIDRMSGAVQRRFETLKVCFVCSSEDIQLFLSLHLQKILYMQKVFSLPDNWEQGEEAVAFQF